MIRVVIQIKERINPDWSEWFGELIISHPENGGSELSGPIIDQSSLYGLITRIRDLGLSICYLCCKEESSLERTQITKS